MNLFLLWQPYFHDYYISLNILLVLIIFFLSFWIEDLWLKRCARYGATLLLIVLDSYFYSFVSIEDQKMQVSAYHISPVQVIESSIGLFFFGIAFFVQIVTVTSLVCFALFKLAQKVFYKLRVSVGENS